MKLKLTTFAFLAIVSIQGQVISKNDINKNKIIFETENETSILEEESGNFGSRYLIKKVNTKTKEKISDLNLHIPNKKESEVCYSAINMISTLLIDKDVNIIYDVYNKRQNLKKCYLKRLNIESNVLSDPILLNESPCESKFTIVRTIYRVIYSQDKTKFALLLDNYNIGVFVDPTIVIFDTKKATEITTKKLKPIYNGNKIQIDPYKNFTLNNNGNISLIFNTLNEKTNIVIKSYKGDIIFNDNNITNITEILDTTTDNTQTTVSKVEQGRFYNSFEDYTNNKPIQEYRIKNGSCILRGAALDGKETIQIINKNGDIKEESAFNLPSILFTYRREYDSNFSLLRVFNGRTYKVFTFGNICLYGLNYDNAFLYISEDGAKGEVKEFKEKDLIKKLEENSLLDSYKMDKPKREYKDSALDYFIGGFKL